MKNSKPSVLSIFLIALILSISCAVTTNAEEAAKSVSIEKLKKEANEGNPGSQYWLGVCYNQGQGGVKQDYAEAYKWFRKAHEGGERDASYMLGICLKKGEGVAQNYAQAIELFRKSAEQGDSASQYEMGEFYFKGLGVKQDSVEAVKFWRKSAEKGDFKAQLSLGLCYANGKGVLRDLVQAYMWFDIAANEGRVAVAEKQRDQVSAGMTPEQLVEAKKMSKEWKLSKK